MRFNGDDYVPERDNQISKSTGDPEASVSAQLRHLRKRRFGEHLVERRYCGDGLYEYKLTPNDEHPDS
jgi:hypothetical protein